MSSKGNAAEAKRYLDTIFQPPEPSVLDYAALYGVDTSKDGWRGVFINRLLNNESNGHSYSNEFGMLDDAEILRLGVVIPGIIGALVG